MKKTLVTSLLLLSSMQNFIYSSDANVEQEVVVQDEGVDEFIFDEPLLPTEEELPINLVIAPTKRSFSVKDIPFYAKLFFSYMFEKQLKPAYYAVVGFIIGNKK